MAQQVSNDSIILKAKCHCGAFNTQWSIPRDRLPLKSALCSCGSCRKISGQMFASWAVMPEDAINITDAGAPERVNHTDWRRRNIGGNNVTQYAFGKNLTRNFCSTCGAAIANFEPGEWEFASGIVSVDWNGQRPQVDGLTPPVDENDIQGLLDRQSLFVGDAPDGGAAVWFPKLNSAGREIKMHRSFRNDEVVDPHAAAKEFAEKGKVKGTDEEVLEASCHCGTIRFFVTRPDSADPPPAQKKAGNTRSGKWWLGDETDPNCRKYQGLLDACTSCRLTTGFEVLTWTFIPPNNLFVLGEDNDWANRRPYDPNEPSLKLSHYYSSNGIRRSFCSTCGAPILYLKESRDPRIFDFGVGLFSGEGARFEDWVEWKELEYGEDAIDAYWVKEIAKRVKAE